MNNIDYYNTNATAFFENTATLDMNHLYERFCPYIPVGGSILDAGCGSGRDTLFFSRQYDVDSFDASEEMAKMASQHTNKDVQVATFQSYTHNKKYDGIWCCASMLHVEDSEIQLALSNMRDHLKPHGHMYLSFRHNEYNDSYNGRTFTNMTEERFIPFIAPLGLKLVECWITEDVRTDRSNEWINFIVEYVPQFQLMSDLHTEFCEDSYRIHPQAKHINLLIAGDLGTVRAKYRYHRILSVLCEAYKTVTLVAGNHEYYGYNINRVDEFLVEMESMFDNFTYLNKNHTTIDGVHIIGCTLWTDFGNSKENREFCEAGMNDYKKIRYGTTTVPYDKLLTSKDTLAFNHEHREYIFNTIGKIRGNDPDAKILVLTHHAPLLESCWSNPNRIKEYDTGYANDYRELLSQYKPNMWCHGHIHEAKTYTYESTCVKCEPTGYITHSRIEQTGYDPFKVFNVL